MIDPSMLATGGLIALLATGWQQVKTAASYLSSFIVIRAEFSQEPMSEIVTKYIRRNFTVLPSGNIIYKVSYLEFRGIGFRYVPFRLLPDTAIFIKGYWRIMLVNHKHGYTKLMSLRGMFDFDKLVSNALDDFHISVVAATEDNSISRFYIRKIVGAEKHGLRFDTSKNSSSAEPTRLNVAGSPESTGASTRSIDLDIDVSFKYDRSDYQYKVDVNPFEGLYYPPEVMRYVEQAKRWIKMEDWYRKRQIPHRRGWLLQGPGGTGKSSMATALARELRVPLYQYFLATLSDQEFMDAWSGMVTPCVTLLEDFDTVFDLRTSLTEHKSLTFDCVLNQISGVSAIDGVFLIVTTNHMEKIDPAMGVECGKNGISTRPGRIDTVIHLGNITRENKIKLANRILRDWPSDVDDVVNSSGDVTPIQFQELCIQRAFDRIHEMEMGRVLTLVKEA